MSTPRNPNCLDCGRHLREDERGLCFPCRLDAEADAADRARAALLQEVK